MSARTLLADPLVEVGPKMVTLDATSEVFTVVVETSDERRALVVRMADAHRVAVEIGAGEVREDWSDQPLDAIGACFVDDRRPDLEAEIGSAVTRWVTDRISGVGSASGDLNDLLLLACHPALREACATASGIALPRSLSGETSASLRLPGVAEPVKEFETRAG